jgi:hypothetical protein
MKRRTKTAPPKPEGAINNLNVIKAAYRKR